ncbi:MAG: hypothetical protein RLZZ444_1962, partial [Pseudomonadota bacterium]
VLVCIGIVLGENVTLDLDDPLLAHAGNMNARDTLAVMNIALVAMVMVMIMPVIVMRMVMVMVVGMVVAVSLAMVVMVVVFAIMIMIMMMIVVVAMAMMMVMATALMLVAFDGCRSATAYRAHQITSMSLIFNSSPAVI